MHPVTVFIERFTAAVSVHIGPCCPALLELYSCKMCTLLYYWANKMMILSAIIMVPRTASPSVGIERRPPTHLMYLCLEIMAGDDFHSVTYFLT